LLSASPSSVAIRFYLSAPDIFCARLSRELCACLCGFCVRERDRASRSEWWQLKLTREKRLRSWRNAIWLKGGQENKISFRRCQKKNKNWKPRAPKREAGHQWTYAVAGPVFTPVGAEMFLFLKTVYHFQFNHWRTICKTI
jgi:hypothetical protein